MKSRRDDGRFVRFSRLM